MQRIVFAGTPEFAVPALKKLLVSRYEVVGVYTQPDKPSGRGQTIMMSPVKQAALEYHLPVFQPVSLRGAEEQKQLAALQPDLIIVAAYGLILPKAVLEIPPLGCLNIHASLLPRWRGASPIQYALLKGDPETGISMMQMAEGLDTGPVLKQAVCPITVNDTAGTLHDKLALLGAEVLLEVLSDLTTLFPVPQEEEKACYAPKITKQQGMIDWSQEASDIDRMVRAFNPWPVAYTFFEGGYIRIWEGKVSPDKKTDALPGTIIAVSKEDVSVAAGNGTVYNLTKVQPANSKILAVKDYLNASHISEGKRLECS